MANRCGAKLCEAMVLSLPDSFQFKVEARYLPGWVRANRLAGAHEIETKIAGLKSKITEDMALGLDFADFRVPFIKLLYFQRELSNYCSVSPDGFCTDGVNFDLLEWRSAGLEARGFEKAGVPVFSGLAQNLMAITTRRHGVMIEGRLSNLHVLEAWNPYTGHYSHSEFLVVDVATREVRSLMHNKSMTDSMKEIRGQVDVPRFAPKLNCFSCHAQKIETSWDVDEHLPDKELVFGLVPDRRKEVPPLSRFFHDL